MTTITQLRSAPQMQALESLYAELGWNEQRRAGMNRRVIKHDTPRTAQEAQAIYQALQHMLMNYVRPHQKAFKALVHTLYKESPQLSTWERGFVADVARRLRGGLKITVTMVKKVRQIAHVRGFECGFPNFRELSKAADAKRQTQHTSQHKGR